MDTPRTGEPSADTSVWDPPLPAAPGFAHTVVETPGLRTHVAAVGDGPPILLLHGFPQHWWQWREIAPALAARGHRVVCPDLRGAGWTAADRPGIRAADRLADVVALLDALGIPAAHVVTHDLGALTGMHLAYAHPDRVRALVQLSVPPGFLRFSPRMIPAFRHYPRMLWDGPRRSLRHLFAPPYVVHPLSEEALDAYLRVESRAEVRRAVRAVLGGMIAPEMARLMGGHYARMRLRPPTLVAFGSEDRPFSEELVRHVSRDSARCADRFELAFVPGASHFVTDDAPEAVTALIADWIEAHPAAA